MQDAQFWAGIEVVGDKELLALALHTQAPTVGLG